MDLPFHRLLKAANISITGESLSIETKSRWCNTGLDLFLCSPLTGLKLWSVETEGLNREGKELVIKEVNSADWSVPTMHTCIVHCIHTMVGWEQAFTDWWTCHGPKRPPLHAGTINGRYFTWQVLLVADILMQDLERVWNKRFDQEVTENSLSMWDTALPWAPQRLVQDNKTLVSQQVGTARIVFYTSEYSFSIQIWPDTLAIGKGGSEVKHRKNCECCPVSQLIVRKQRLSWIQVLNCQNCNQCLKCHLS